MSIVGYKWRRESMGEKLRNRVTERKEGGYHRVPRKEGTYCNICRQPPCRAAAQPSSEIARAEVTRPLTRPSPYCRERRQRSSPPAEPPRDALLLWDAVVAVWLPLFAQMARQLRTGL